MDQGTRTVWGSPEAAWNVRCPPLWSIGSRKTVSALRKAAEPSGQPRWAQSCRGRSWPKAEWPLFGSKRGADVLSGSPTGGGLSDPASWSLCPFPVRARRYWQADAALQSLGAEVEPDGAAEVMGQPALQQAGAEASARGWRHGRSAPLPPDDIHQPGAASRPLQLLFAGDRCLRQLTIGSNHTGAGA